MDDGRAIPWKLVDYIVKLVDVGEFGAPDGYPIESITVGGRKVLIEQLRYIHEEISESLRKEKANQ